MKDLSEFRNWLLINGSSLASAKTRCDKVASFFRQYDVFNQENLNSFLASKINLWSGASFNLNLNSFNHYAKFLKMEIEIPKWHRVEKRIKPYITDKEFYDILAKTPLIFKNPDKTQAILMLMFSTGLRPKEVVQLKRENFNFETKTVSIKNTKTHIDKVVVLSNELCTMLPAIFNQEVEQTNAFNITNPCLAYIFQRINEMLGLKLTPYLMRHSFAHNMIEKKIKISSLQVLMGHSNPLTTLNYLRVSEKEALDEARAILNKKKK